MNKLATLLSTLFHPLLMPTYGIAIALYTSYMRIFGDRLLGIVIIYSASLGLMFPGASALSALLYGRDDLSAKMIISHTGVACLLYVILGIPYFCLLNAIM